MTYYLPNETARMIERRVRACKNLGLILDKYIPITVFEKPDRNDKNKGKTPWLLNILEPLDAKNSDKKQSKHIDFDLAHNAYQRWLTLTKAMGALPFDLALDWRMIVGLGGETVLETDITLHPLYGIPFIPGSALKGLTRSYVAKEYHEYHVPAAKPEEQRKASKKTDDDHPEIKLIFGSQDNAGTVIFFDAMPLNGHVVFELDIMNPHYPKYYGENALPTNDQDPNPITFLTVANTTFTFAIAPRDATKVQHVNDVELVKKWLQEALQKYGVGGKTSAGYGYFKKFESQPRLPEDAYVSKEDVSQTSEPYVRPSIPIFREGQKITGVVFDPQKDAEALKGTQIGEASFCLRYREFPIRQVLIVIPTGYSGIENWRPGHTKHCTFVREEVQGNCTVLICKP